MSESKFMGEGQPDQPSPPSGPAAGSARLGTCLGLAAAEIVAGVLHPALAEALAIADLAIPSLAALIVFTVIVRGSAETCNRVFRLLRWIAGRPEPTAPAIPGEAPPESTESMPQRCIPPAK
jgi:hypothetical protein